MGSQSSRQLSSVALLTGTLTLLTPVVSDKPPDGRGSRTSPKEPSYWLFVAIIVLVFVGGLVVRSVFNRGSNVGTGDIRSQTLIVVYESSERKVQLVASNFRCTCGGCGELPLIECDCGMPRGGIEEKSFIREKLKEGLPVDRVIQLVETTYGLKTASQDLFRDRFSQMVNPLSVPIREADQERATMNSVLT